MLEARVNGDSSVERLRERQEAAGASSGVETNVKAASCSLDAMVRPYCHALKRVQRTMVMTPKHNGATETNANQSHELNAPACAAT